MSVQLRETSYTAHPAPFPDRGFAVPGGERQCTAQVSGPQVHFAWRQVRFLEQLFGQAGHPDFHRQDLRALPGSHGDSARDSSEAWVEAASDRGLLSILTGSDARAARLDAGREAVHERSVMVIDAIEKP